MFINPREIVEVGGEVGQDVTLTDGALPEEIVDERTGSHECPCSYCGRPMGPGAAPGVSLFDLGITHALNRLALLLQDVGISSGEAHAIVLKIQSRDVEL